MTISLYRHGRTARNGERRYQGRSDVPLSDDGARALRKAPFEPGAVYVSPLLRARQSAELLFPGARQIVVPAFAEFDFGAFEGRSALEMADDKAYRAWVESGCETRCPGGDSRTEFCARTRAAFEPLPEDAVKRGDAHLVIVAHSGTLRAIMEGFALPERAYFDWDPPCGGGYALTYDQALWHERRKLRYAGAVSCLREGAP